MFYAEGVYETCCGSAQGPVGLLGMGKSSAVTQNRHRKTRPEPALTASEIANFEFCPVAWYLQRSGATRDSTSIRNMEDSVREHRRIATHATRAKTLQGAQTLLVFVIVVLVAAVLLQILNDGGPIRP
jgi:hypothetical protein